MLGGGVRVSKGGCPGNKKGCRGIRALSKINFRTLKAIHNDSLPPKDLDMTHMEKRMVFARKNKSQQTYYQMRPHVIG